MKEASNERVKMDPESATPRGATARRTCGSDSVGAVRSKVRLAASHKHLKGESWCQMLAEGGPECGKQPFSTW